QALSISGNIKEGDKTFFREFKVYQLFAYMVRRVMLTWNSLQSPSDFTDETQLKGDNMYGTERVTPPYGDSDWRGYLDWVINKGLIETTEFLGELPYTKTFYGGGYRPPGSNKTYLSMADHWTVRKLGFSNMRRPIDIAQMFLDFDIKDIHITEPFDENVTPCGLEVILGKEYDKSNYVDLHYWRFFLLKKPFKESTKETERVLDNIEAFKKHIVFARREYKKLAWSKDDKLGNIKKAEKLFDLARQGLLLSQEQVVLKLLVFLAWQALVFWLQELF
ncbi:unnamed protein product, partial [marine sediment metagenome]